MKNIAIVVLITLILTPVLFTQGCSPKVASYGQPIAESEAAGIGDILAHPAKFSGKTVKVNGKIVEECPSGGWIILEDGPAIIYVDLHSSNFAIPQAVGRRAIAQGTVKKTGPQVSMVGRGVELK